MRNIDLKQRRDSDLYAAYVEALRSNTFSTVREAIGYVLSRPAPLFYVSPRTASKLIGRIMSGDSLSDLHPLSRKRAFRLYEEYKAYSGILDGSSREAVMEVVVEKQAPEFYLSPSRARMIIFKELRKVRRRMTR